MEVKRRDVEGVAVLDLAGRLMGGPEAAEFEREIQRLLAEGRVHVLVNLDRVNWINSTGLGVLISAYTAVRGAGGALRLAGASERIDNILDITKLSTVFESFPDEATALGSYRKR